MRDIQISNSFAFGTGLSVSDGGAIFVSSSQLTITGSSEDKSQFRFNSAGTGGAIAGFDCSVFFSNVKFEYNTAFKFAGAISCESTVNIEIDHVNVNRYQIKDTECYIIKCNIKNNCATELGGGVFLELLGTTYLEEVNFANNTAGHSGGAAFMSKTEASFYNCKFNKNLAGERILVKGMFDRNIQNKGSFAPIGNMRRVHRGGLVRSGGAISFNVIDYGPKTDASHDPFPTNHPEPTWDFVTNGKTNWFELVTSGCCFNGNRAFNEHGSAGTDVRGYSIHLAGPVQYNSFQDVFDTDDEHKIISINQMVVDNADKGDKEWNTATYNFFGNTTNHKKCSDGLYIGVPDYDNGPEPQKKQDKSFNSVVPRPTSFIYQSTPLTRLPYATTRSHKYTEALTKKVFTLTTHTKTKDPIATPSASRSVSATPSRSVSSTPSMSVSSTPSRSVSATPTVSDTATASNSIDTRRPTDSPKETATASRSVSSTPSRSVSSTPSRSVSPSPSPSAFPSASASPSVSMSPVPSISPSPTPSRSGGKYSRRTNVLTDSPIFVQSVFWISNWSYTTSYDDDHVPHTSIIFGSFSPWLSGGTVLSYTEKWTSYLDYSDGPFEIYGSYSISITQSVSIISVMSQTYTVSYTMVSGGQMTAFASETFVPSYIWIYTETVFDVEMTFNIAEESVDETYTMSAGLIIGLATGGTVIIFILAIIGVYTYRQLKVESSDIISANESSDDFNENENMLDDTVLSISGQITAHFNQLSQMIMDINDETKEVNGIPVDDDWLD